MDIILGILIALVAVCISKMLHKKDDENSTTQKVEDQKEIGEYKGAYQSKYLLTKNEWYEYRKLRDYAAAKGLQVCPKVRVLDLIEPRRGHKNYMTLINKVKAKHVDFVICDQDLRVKAILELDDNSHNAADRRERDEFLQAILEDVGYLVIHTKGITEETLKDIPDVKKPTT